MKLKLTLRDLFWLVLVVGLALGWWNQYRQLSQGLYEDAEIKALELRHAVGSDDRGILCLVVEFGDARPRSEVFSELGIAEHRLRNFRAYGAMGDYTLSWQVSTGYDVVCMTNGETPMLLTDPKRKVYGVHLRERDNEEP